ncbi:hypothetical protein XF_0057 [Xylella fastidiosa 9a5c]|uniref:Uncharacterized protein n=1 Tax=Xylella fastidiosa (strain 9a5c) TaxID=160492 RepID=Q9PH87_XYLFA|nr:hypothetical protein XF_0057 [Xylella fastidiosa 9a5c]
MAALNLEYQCAHCVVRFYVNENKLWHIDSMDRYKRH